MGSRLRFLSVGGNPLSAFLAWRLQASNACDVTLVWRKNPEHVKQAGLTFRSQKYGNERWRPLQVVGTPEEAANSKDGAFDFVVLSIKALPDVYDLASVIESVVAPEHTCIVVNSTNVIGVEAALEERFPANVVLSLVSHTDLHQLGATEFEQTGPSSVWVGASNNARRIPASTQENMAQALALTLNSGIVECNVSPNIRQQQFERAIGPTAFHPLGVIFETSNHQALLEKPGVPELVDGVLDEMLSLAEAEGCKLPESFKNDTIAEMTRPGAADTVMWQDFVARRPMEVETYLGSPVRLARLAGIAVPRLETLYAILRNVNSVNQMRPKGGGGGDFSPSSPSVPSPNPRTGHFNGPQTVRSGGGNTPRPQQRPRNSSNLGRRPPLSGHNNGQHQAIGGGGGGGGGSRQTSRRSSFDDDLEEFSHIMEYAEDAEDGSPDNEYSQQPPSHPDMLGDGSRDRDMSRDRGVSRDRDQPSRMRRPLPPPTHRPGPQPGPRRGAHAPHPGRQTRNGSRAPSVYEDEDDDEEGYEIPPRMRNVDPNSIDMVSYTSRKNRVIAYGNQVQTRRNLGNAELDTSASRGRFWSNFRGPGRASQMGNNVAPISEDVLDDPMMSFSSNRYGTVDRGFITDSRTNSLTSQRLEEIGHFGGGAPRRTSQAQAQGQGQAYGPALRGGGPANNNRPHPAAAGNVPNGRPSPPESLRHAHGHHSPPAPPQQSPRPSGGGPQAMGGGRPPSAAVGNGEPPINARPPMLNGTGNALPVGVR